MPNSIIFNVKMEGLAYNMRKTNVAFIFIFFVLGNNFRTFASQPIRTK